MGFKILPNGQWSKVWFKLVTGIPNAQLSFLLMSTIHCICLLGEAGRAQSYHTTLGMFEKSIYQSLFTWLVLTQV